MHLLAAPLEPVTSASPLVTATASTLPAANASIDGTYSNQVKSTATPASLNQPFWMAMSQATQPGQSLYAMRSAGPAAAGAAAGAAVAGTAALGASTGASVVSGLASSFLLQAPKKMDRPRTAAYRSKVFAMGMIDP